MLNVFDQILKEIFILDKILNNCANVQLFAIKKTRTLEDQSKKEFQANFYKWAQRQATANKN